LDRPTTLSAHDPISPSGLEPPAGRPAGLGRQYPEDRPRLDRVEVPRRRAGARRAVFVGEGAVLHGGRPTLVAVALRESLERLVVGHSFGLALDDQVDAGQCERDRAMGVLGDVPALARPGAAHEVDPALIP